MKDTLALVGLLFLVWCGLHYVGGLTGQELAHLVGTWLQAL